MHIKCQHIAYCTYFEQPFVDTLITQVALDDLLYVYGVFTFVCCCCIVLQTEGRHNCFLPGATEEHAPALALSVSSLLLLTQSKEWYLSSSLELRREANKKKK